MLKKALEVVTRIKSRNRSLTRRHMF